MFSFTKQGKYFFYKSANQEFHQCVGFANVLFCELYEGLAAKTGRLPLVKKQAGFREDKAFPEQMEDVVANGKPNYGSLKA